jgi:peptidoglycan/LPS O-acetylase OafA/YrhL
LSVAAVAGDGRRFTQLDGLRGLAAMMVALCHFISAFQLSMLDGNAARAHFALASWIAGTPLIFFYDPDLGVAVFFILSGFVLAASAMAQPAGLPELALRRWLRLSLPILAASFFVYAISLAGLIHNGPAAALSGSAWLAAHYAPTLFWNHNSPGYHLWFSLFGIYAWAYPASNSSLWTIPFELYGSFALFLFYCWLGVRQASGWLRLAAALIAAAHSWKTDYAGFALGAGLFEIVQLLRAAPQWRFPRGLAWGGGLVLLAAGLSAGGWPYTLTGGPYLWLWQVSSRWVAEPTLLAHRLGALFLVGAALSFPPLRTVLNARPCQFLGRVSFMSYLLHVPLIASVASWTLVLCAPVLGYNLASAAALVVCFGSTLALAALFTSWVDGPAVRFSRLAAATAIRGLRSRLRFGVASVGLTGDLGVAAEKTLLSD